MGIRELIKIVQEYSGFSDTESKDALEMMIESLAVHLDEVERKDFASQLPEELQDIALSVYPTVETANQDIVEQFMEMEDIDESRAKQQISSVWRALKETFSEGQIRRIRSQLPSSISAVLG